MPVFVKVRCQLLPGSTEPAFHGTDRTSEFLGSGIIGASLYDNIFEHDTVRFRQQIAGLFHFLGPYRPFLRWRGHPGAGNAFRDLREPRAGQCGTSCKTYCA